MRKAKVIAYSVSSGLGSGIYKSGEIVTEAQIKHFDERIERGFIEEIKEEAETKKVDPVQELKDNNTKAELKVKYKELTGEDVAKSWTETKIAEKIVEFNK